MSWFWFLEFWHALRTVLGDVVEVIPADNEGAGHLGRYNTASQDASTDGDVTSERALLVYTR